MKKEICNSTDPSPSVSRQDLDYWLERQTEYQQTLNVIESRGENSESVWKLRGKLEAVGETIAYLQRKINNP
ncbi:MAG: hypothetical protein RIE73_16905 [Coleofasciculus sp. C1-SOL-03]|uniref:hypothetical protein n=1 Tax=Coleofasciculus sp. C1-SOL-03 TaxID=3069522 RepID=UPI0032F8F827